MVKGFGGLRIEIYKTFATPHKGLTGFGGLYIVDRKHDEGTRTARLGFGCRTFGVY